ncbi:hypothetical protein J3Q64DRAFT_1283602 [Phycomyces blakesleeanus]|uniref:RRM domain-containing protein n=1 Tax=Phycomyces blakesleeanus TaxID=4837 RepID=A0ABR3ANW2_PHYBL
MASPQVSAVPVTKVMEDGEKKYRRSHETQNNIPTSPPYPPYYGHIDPAQMAAAYEQHQQSMAAAYEQHQQSVAAATAAAAASSSSGGGGATGGAGSTAVSGGFDPNDASHYAYVYPLSPQFSVQYYSDYGYQSYPGSPALHPQSPPMNPQSPPFSPTYPYHQAGGLTLSPPAHAYMLPPHGQNFPPLHISPILTGAASVPGSPPHPYLQPLPGPFHLNENQRSKRHHHHHNSNNNTNNNHHSGNSNGASAAAAAAAVAAAGSAAAAGGSAAVVAAAAAAAAAQELEDEQMMHYHSLNIYVRGLSSTINDDSFLDLCEEYGKVVSSKAILDQKTGECKGYGFAMYEREEDCQASIDGLNKAGLQASFARVGHESFSSRLRHLQDETSTNIYISNLPLDMTEQKLEDLFKPCLTVSNRILRDPQSGMSRGVGFARLSDRGSAMTIIEKFSGYSIPGSSAPLQVRFADSPAQKKLKNQTARKRMFRPRDFQSMGGFPIRQMPITPETMLGIAPTPMANMSAYYQNPANGYTYRSESAEQSTPPSGPEDSLASPPSESEKAVLAGLDNMTITEKQPVNQEES